MLAQVIAYIIAILVIVASVIREYLAGSTIYAKVGGSDTGRRYCAVSAFVGAKYISESLPGWTEVSPTDSVTAPVDFFYYDGRSHIAKQYYSVRARVRYWLDSVNIWDKAKLHTILGECAPDTICRTIIFNDTTKDPPQLPPGVWMVRSNLGAVGSKSRAVDNQRDFMSAVSDFTRDTGKDARRKDVIMASEYIADPMLYQGKKFHLRCYVILAVYGHGPTATRRAWMIKQGIIIPAAVAYVRGDWSNQEVHDSHGHDNADLVYFHEATPNADLDIPLLTAKCADVLSHALECVMPTVTNYPECGHIGYEVSGADIMFTSDGNAKIIEINGAPAIGDNTRESIQNIFDSVLATVYTDEFGPAGNPDMVISLM
jgi:hypothetical protein